MNTRIISAYVYWQSDGRFIALKRIIVDKDNTNLGTIINDGRRVQFMDNCRVKCLRGKWVVAE